MTPAVLPLPILDQLADLPLDEVALERAEMRNEKVPAEVIRLMTEGARQQPFALHGEWSALGVLRANGGLVGPGDRLAKTRNAQAAFLLALLPFRGDDRRVNDNVLGFGVFADAAIDHRDAPRDADLRRRQPHAVGRIH